MAFPTGSFDFVAASFVIHVLDNPGTGVAKAYRVLASSAGAGRTTGQRAASSPGPVSRPSRRAANSCGQYPPRHGPEEVAQVQPSAPPEMVGALQASGAVQSVEVGLAFLSNPERDMYPRSPTATA